MAGQLRRFTRPEVLREIRAERLQRLLIKLVHENGWLVPEPPERMYPEKLAQMLADSRHDVPPAVIDVFYLIDQMATPGGLDAIRRVISQFRASPLEGDEMSPADAAVETWLDDPNLLIRAHASQLSVRNRTLRLFALTGGAAVVPAGEEPGLIAGLRDHLARELRDAGLPEPNELFAFPHSSGVVYVIQRGGPFVRHGALVEGKPSTVGYEPLAFDVVAYDSIHFELAVKAHPPGEQEALRRAFGCALASDGNAFARPVVMNLEDIRNRLRECLWCEDVPGITRVTLRGISTMLQGGVQHVQDERASDLFRAWDRVRSGPPTWGIIRKATFEFTFADSPRPRSVTVEHGAALRFTRDDDADLIQAFLRQRGMLGGFERLTETQRELWTVMEQPEKCCATASEWRRRLGDGHDLAKRYFRPTGSLAEAIRLDGEPADRMVRRDPAEGFLAVCVVTGKIDRVETDDITLWAIDFGAIAVAMSHALGLNGQTGPVADHAWAWSLGEFCPVAGERFTVYLVAAPDAVSMQATCRSLASLDGRPPIIVTPTRRHAVGGGRPAGAATLGWVSLAESARLAIGGDIVFSRSLSSLAEQFLKVHVPQLFGKPLRPRFPTPTGSLWSDVSITFKDRDTVQVTVKGTTRLLTYAEMGFMHSRSKKPTVQWMLLVEFARGHGVLTWSSRGAGRRNQKRREDLGKQLSEYFVIDDDPFVRHDNGWRARFELHEELPPVPRTDRDDE